MLARPTAIEFLCVGFSDRNIVTYYSLLIFLKFKLYIIIIQTQKSSSYVSAYYSWERFFMFFDSGILLFDCRFCWYWGICRVKSSKLLARIFLFVICLWISMVVTTTPNNQETTRKNTQNKTWNTTTHRGEGKWSFEIITREKNLRRWNMERKGSFEITTREKESQKMKRGTKRELWDYHQRKKIT